MEQFRSGYVAIIGRPNVGKSTLLNTILGEKISIVTPKPQTTQRRLIGIKTSESSQIVFIDTPGIHQPHHKLGEFMVKEAKEALEDVDLILFMVEPRLPGAGERAIIDILKQRGRACPVFLLINKVDTVKKPSILPMIEEYGKLYRFLVSLLDRFAPPAHERRFLEAYCAELATAFIIPSRFTPMVAGPMP